GHGTEQVCRPKNRSRVRLFHLTHHEECEETSIMARARNFRGNSRSGRFGRRTGVVEIITHPEANPVLQVLGLIVRLRAELATLTVVLTAYFILRARIGPDST